MSEAPTRRRIPRARLVHDYVAENVSKLQSMYLQSVPSARAQLAVLRRQDPATDEGVLETMSVSFDDPPEGILGRGDHASATEKAVAAALILYAMHQQSKNKPMHVPGVGLGAAVRRLANPGDAETREKPVMRRFQALASATSINAILYHMRGMVQQLRASDVPLDYARLASDLAKLQNPASATGVRLSWARDLATVPRRADKEDQGGGDEAVSPSSTETIGADQ